MPEHLLFQIRGNVLVKEAIENDIKVVPIPGACAAITALCASNLDTSEFSFIGFLPLNKKLRKEKLGKISKETKTLVLYEAPHKIKTTLEDLLQYLGNRQVSICRELTKIHEEFIRGNLTDVINSFENPKGEFVILIEGLPDKVHENIDFSSLSLDEHYKLYSQTGFDKKEIIKKIAKDRNIPKNDVYKYFIK